MSIQSFLQGKKSYIVMIAGVAAALAGYATGELSLGEAITAGIGSLGIGTLRAGIAKGK